MWRNEMLGTKNERRVDRCVLLQLLSQSVCLGDGIFYKKLYYVYKLRNIFAMVQ